MNTARSHGKRHSTDWQHVASCQLAATAAGVMTPVYGMSRRLAFEAMFVAYVRRVAFATYLALAAFVVKLQARRKTSATHVHLYLLLCTGFSLLCVVYEPRPACHLYFRNALGTVWSRF